MSALPAVGGPYTGGLCRAAPSESLPTPEALRLGSSAWRWCTLVLVRAGLRGPERVVVTLAGLALIVWWMLPVSIFPSVVEMSFLSGVTMLLGAVWVVAYNVGLLRRLPAPSGLWRLSTPTWPRIDSGPD